MANSIPQFQFTVIRFPLENDPIAEASRRLADKIPPQCQNLQVGNQLLDSPNCTLNTVSPSLVMNGMPMCVTKSSYLAKKPDCRVVGIDIADAMIARAQQKVEREQVLTFILDKYLSARDCRMSVRGPTHAAPHLASISAN